MASLLAMTSPARTWLDEFAAALGTAPPTTADIEDLLSLASVAAHASERAAAPVACWLAARAGRTPGDALAAAHELEAVSDHTSGRGPTPSDPDAPAPS